MGFTLWFGRWHQRLADSLTEIRGLQLLIHGAHWQHNLILH